MSLNWRGDEVKRLVLERMAGAMGEFGLVVEAESKRELRKGHGVLTGTLRRSIHAAAPGYQWSTDDVPPGSDSPERGGAPVQASQVNGVVTVEVGSGLRYALPVHQGHGAFGGYHYLTNGLEKAKPKLAQILKRWQV